MKTLDVYKEVSSGTNTYYDAQVGDKIETLGAKEKIETYVVDHIYGERKDYDNYGVVTAFIIKKDGSKGKKMLKLTNTFDSKFGDWGVKTTVHTK